MHATSVRPASKKGHLNASNQLQNGGMFTLIFFTLLMFFFFFFFFMCHQNTALPRQCEQGYGFQM